jgi:hypothetical protein
MKSFLSRFGSIVLFVLSGFDRLRLRGDSRLLNHPRGVDSYLIQQRILRKDFAAHAKQLTDTLCLQTETSAQHLGVPFQYLNSTEIDKQAVVGELVAKNSSKSSTTKNTDIHGRLALLSCVEPCHFYRYFKNDAGLFQFRKQLGKCLHYYHYFQHPRFGFCHVRIQTWFPFTVHVALNGREWLCRQLDDAKIKYQREGNLLFNLADPARAQRLFDQQRHAHWPALLSQLVEPIHPNWSYLHDDVNTPYHWMAEQSEWATDYVFKDAADLGRLFPRFIRHGLETLQCQDILRYFNKNIPGRCNPEDVKVHYADRDHGPYAGTRLKFWHKTNSIKFYDKESIALRLETTINQAKEFRVFRHTEHQDKAEPKDWHDMRKSVADMPRRAEVAQTANNRLAESLASIEETIPLGKLLEPLGKPVIHKGQRKARALNPLTGADGKLLALLANGDFLINGFRNRDLRAALYGSTNDADLRRKQSAAVTRQLALLRAHHLINKVPKTHRYRLSTQGQRISTALSAAQTCDVNHLTKSI